MSLKFQLSRDLHGSKWNLHIPRSTRSDDIELCDRFLFPGGTQPFSCVVQVKSEEWTMYTCEIWMLWLEKMDNVDKSDAEAQLLNRLSL